MATYSPQRSLKKSNLPERRSTRSNFGIPPGSVFTSVRKAMSAENLVETLPNLAKESQNIGRTYYSIDLVKSSPILAIEMTKNSTIYEKSQDGTNCTKSQIEYMRKKQKLEEETFKEIMEQRKNANEKKLRILKFEQEIEERDALEKENFLKEKLKYEFQIIDLENELLDNVSIISKPNISSLSPREKVTQRVTGNVLQEEGAFGTVQEISKDEVLLEAFKALKCKQVKGLPYFNGEIMEWIIFFNELETSTRQFNIKPEENSRRLNKALQGKARKAVEALLYSAENIEQIIKILKMNFGRPEWVIMHLIDRIRNLPIVREDNLESFRKFYNDVFGTVVTVKNIHGECYLLNPELLISLAEKLPPFSKNAWYRHKATLIREGRIVDLESFVRWLEEELDTMFASFNPFSKKSNQSYIQAPRKATIMNISVADQKIKYICCVCSSKEHNSLSKCDNFIKMTVEERRETAKKQHVCFNCLKIGHNSRICKKKVCSKCGYKHNDLVHLDKIESVVQSDEQSTSLQLFEEQEPNLLNFKSSDALLRVGRIKVYGVNGFLETFALFDEGSTSSMMETSLANELGLEGNIVPITYRWTNGIAHTDNNSTIVNLKISGPCTTSKIYNFKDVRTVEHLFKSNRNRRGCNFESINPRQIQN